MNRTTSTDHLKRYVEAQYAELYHRVLDIAALLKCVHGGEQGRVLEQAVSDALRRFLPERFSVGTGFVINSGGEISKQCDIIIWDRLMTYNPFSYAGQVVFPIESVVAVVEVKTTLTKKGVTSACANILSVKELCADNVDSNNAPENLYHIIRPLGVVFAFNCDCTNVATIPQWFADAFRGCENKLLFPDLSGCVLAALKVEVVPEKSPPHRSLRFEFYPGEEFGSAAIRFKDNDGTQECPDPARLLLMWLHSLARLIDLGEPVPKSAYLRYYYEREGLWPKAMKIIPTPQSKDVLAAKPCDET